MRKLMMLLVLASIACAQGVDDEVAPEVTKYRKKLKSNFIKNADWVLDYDAAKKQAKESGKVLFAYFSRSYAP